MACASAAAVAVRVAVSQGSGEGIFALGAGTGVTLLILGLGIGRATIAYWGVGVVAGFYVASTILVGGLDAWGISTAVALLLSGELAGWSIDSRRRGRDDLAVHGRRLLAILLMVGVGFALAFIVQDSAIFAAGGVVSAGAALVALLGVVAVICLFAWRFARGRV